MNEISIFFQYSWPIAIGLVAYMAKHMVQRVHDDLREHKDAHKEITKELEKVKIEYVHKQDMRDIRDEILARFQRFEDILEALRK
jgi:hypothetical protein